MYKLLNANDFGVATCIKRTADSAFIPVDPANTCYQAYLKWVSEGNSPLPADEPITQNEQPPA